MFYLLFDKLLFIVMKEVVMKSNPLSELRNMKTKIALKQCNDAKVVLMLAVVVYHCFVFWGGGSQITQPFLLQRLGLSQNGWEVFTFLHLL